MAVLHKLKRVKNIWLTWPMKPIATSHTTLSLSDVITWRQVPKVLLLSERDEKLHLDPVLWSYAPGWWDKAPLINARVETAATSRMFKPLWQHGRAICFADGWFEWKKEGDKKQPYFIHRADGQPIFMAAIGSTPFERGDEAEGFLIVTSASDKGLVDIHDRRPLVLSPEAAREWMRQDIGGKEAEEIAADGTVAADKFIWYAVTRAVSNVKNQGPEIIEAINAICSNE